MRRPAMRNRGQGRSRTPTPRPSRPIRGRPKGPPVRGVPKTPPKPRPIRGGRRITEPSRPVRGVPKTPPKPPGGRVPKRVKEPLKPIKKTPPNTGTKGRGGSGTTGGSRLTQIRSSGKSDIRTPRGTRTTAVPKAPPKRVKETLAPTKKTPPNTGTSTKTAQLQKRAQSQAQLDAVRAQRNNPPIDAVPVKGNLPISQRQPTAAEQRQLFEAALRAREAASKSATGRLSTGQAKRVTPAELARIRAGNAARNKAPTGSRVGANLVGTAIRGRSAPTGSRAAAMRRRRRRGGGGLAGALRRRRARIGR